MPDIRRHHRLLPGSLVTILILILVPATVQAVPAFARQMNAECALCHYQHFPKLSEFGRRFKSGGYSLINDEPLSGEDLSLSPNLNLAFFMRSRFVDSSDSPGVWQVPDEAAFLAGGRLAEGAGGMVEWGGPLLSAKLVFSEEFSGTWLGTTVFTTDGLGAGYGFELMNTGAVRNLRGFERSSRVLAGNNSAMEVAGAATGLAFYGAGDHWFAAMTWFMPDSNEAGLSEMDAGGQLSWYLRAAWMPDLGGHEAGIGFGRYGGHSALTTVDDGSGLDAFGNIPGRYRLVTEAWYVDVQFQGSIGSRSLGVYLMHARGDEASQQADVVRLWSGNGTRPPVARGMDLELEVIDGLHLLAVAGAYDDGSPGLSPKTLRGIGLYWRPHQNVSLQPMIEVFGGDQGTDAAGREVRRYTLTLETAF